MDSNAISKLADDAAILRALHNDSEPLLLANIWDPVSAKTIVDCGAKAVATASAAIAPANGYLDHGNMPPAIAFRAIREIADAVQLPVTADFENGYGLTPEEIVEGLIEAGACGLNIEDSDHVSGSLISVSEQAEMISEIKKASSALGVELFVNARIDTHLKQLPMAHGLERAKTYLEAGADCIFPIFVSEKEALKQYCSIGPVSVLYHPNGPELDELRDLGVVRISIGPQLHSAAIARIEEICRSFFAFDKHPFSS